MVRIILVALVLVALTVGLHAAGLAWMFRTLLGPSARYPTRPTAVAWLLIRAAWLLIGLHVAEIGIWALAYLRAGCLPDAESAFYFSGVTYATIGYGDLVIARPWRMLGPVEGLAGTLMSGLSAAAFFAILSRLHNHARCPTGVPGSRDAGDTP